MILNAIPIDLTPMATPEDWRVEAACLTADPELWFSDRADELDLARGFCRGCPVKTRCLDEAMTLEGDTSVRYGIRGGLTGGQRHKLYLHERATK